ncbi:MAG: hypothetical protein ACLUI3_05110 [Christensenellales bacterium]
MRRRPPEQARRRPTERARRRPLRRSRSATPAPTEEPTPTPVPKPVLEVTAEDYEPGVWKNSPPMFTLSAHPEDSTEYVYGVFICDERLILLSDGNNMYVPSEEGLSSVRFVIFG